MGKWQIGAAAAVALLVGAGAARACEGSTVLFEDSFTELQSTWDGSPDEVKVEDGKLHLTTKPDWTVWVPNTAGFYDDIDMCVDVTTVEAADPKTNFAGLVFWYSDDKNFYSFEFDASGNASVWRMQRGKWLKQVSWNEVPALKKGNGETNQMRVVTVGNQATFYLNGTKFASLKGAPPDGGQEVGVIGYSPKAGSADYAFANFKITEPSK
ncbi:MAG TPA: family 16 glycoside hydrolase [Bauldia sp.]|nr:family 16 glycoside hydrolase [Bauldia sp.]